MPAKTDPFYVSRNRVILENALIEEERENEQYAKRHNLPTLFKMFVDELRKHNPQSEEEAQKVLLEFLSHRKAERDRATLRLRFNISYEVSLDNGERSVKVMCGDDYATLQVVQNTPRIKMDDTYRLSLDQHEELVPVFYELGRFISDIPGAKTGGFICIDGKDVFLLSAEDECARVGNDLINLALHLTRGAEKA